MRQVLHSVIVNDALPLDLPEADLPAYLITEVAREHGYPLTAPELPTGDQITVYEPRSAAFTSMAIDDMLFSSRESAGHVFPILDTSGAPCRTVTVDISGNRENFGYFNALKSEYIHDWIMQHGILGDNEAITNLRCIDKSEETKDVVVEAEPVTRYFVDSIWRNQMDKREWEDGFATFDEAKAEAKRVLHSRNDAHTQYKVVPITCSEDGKEIYSISKVITKVTMTFELEISTLSGDEKIGSWQVIGSFGEPKKRWW